MNRRDLLHYLGALSIPLVASGLPATAQTRVNTPVLDNPFFGERNLLAAPWAAWKAAYLAEDGRVVDAMQQGASHSESQGYGMYMAALFGDDAAFDSIFNWTEANLAIRSDALLAWRWLPQNDGGVPDRNNASDGDLFYAWALVVRARRDSNEALMDRARAIATDLAATCIVTLPDGSGRLALMPAAQGFVRDDSIILNPSYYMPRAMREVAQATGVSALATCAADGTAMMARLANDGLIPDWIEIGPQGTFPAVDRPDLNGYEAMRVPLFLIWSGSTDHPAITVQARAYRAAANGGLDGTGDAHATVFDRKTGAIVETSHHVGYGSLAGLVDCVASKNPGAAISFYRTVDQAYYPATLHLMVLIAQISTAPECVPI